MSMFPVQLSEQISLSQMEAADSSACAVDGRIHNCPVQAITTFDHKSRRKNAKSLEVFSRAGGTTGSVLAAHQAAGARQFSAGTMAAGFADVTADRLANGRMKLNQPAAPELDPMLFAKSHFMQAALPAPCN